LTLGLFSRYNELIAMRASGINPLRIGSPFLISALAISLLMTAANLSLVPMSVQRSDTIRYLLIKKRPPDVYFRQSRLWLRAGPKSYMNVQMADSRTSTLHSVHLYKLRDDFSLAEYLEAKSVHYENGEWIVEDAVRRTFEPDGAVKVDRLDRSVLPLNRRPEDFTRIEKDTDKMTYRELANYAATLEEDDYDAQGYRVDLSGKIAMPFMNFVFGLIGIPLGLTRHFGRGIARGIGLSLVLATVYWIVYSLSISFGHGHLLNPWMAAWLPNILFTVIGLSLFLRVGLKE
jgi:lipopolysaccharide export system permease protein